MLNGKRTAHDRPPEGGDRVLCLALLLWTVALTVAPLPVFGAEVVVVGIDAPGYVAVDEAFTIDVTLGPVVALHFARFTVHYDPSVLRNVDTSVVGQFAGRDSSHGHNNPMTGTFSGLVTLLGAAGVSGEGPLLRLTFIPLRAGTTRLSIDAAIELRDAGLGTIASSAGPAALVDVGVSPSMHQRSHWVFDPAPGGNGDGIASPGERVLPRIRLKNVGSGEARNVQVSITTQDAAVGSEVFEVTHAAWPAGEARNNTGLVLLIAPDATPRDVLVTVTVLADNGGPWQFDVVLAIAYPRVFFERRNSWLFDPTPGGNKDGDANPGETIEPKLRLKNLGADAARNVRVALSTSDPSVEVIVGDVTHSTWPAKEARNNDGFLLAIAYDATPREITLVAHVTADNGGPWEFAFVVSVVDLPTRFALRTHWTFDPDGNRDGQADAGERVRPRVRLKNDGSGVARNVRVSLAMDDPTVTVVAGEVVHETWLAGEARNIGFVIDVAPLAASHAASAVVHVTADNGGPWEFPIDIPIVATPTFALRTSWVFDPAPGGNKNGVADAGERVFARVRLRNDGAADAENVRVTVSTNDLDITIVAGSVSHAVWPAMSASSNEGLVLDIAAGASSHVASLTVAVEADDSGPWRFEIPIAVAAAPVFARRSFWPLDKTTGNGDGQVDPGERIEMRVRLKNEGAADAENVVVALSSDDPAVTFVNETVTHATWEAGDARNNIGFVVDVDPTATGSVRFAVDVTADNGGPWRFTYSLPIAPTVRFARRSVWARDRNTGDADGVAEPGEQIELRVRMKNEGELAASNVVVTLSTDDPNAAVASPTVTHATWPAGEARNNVGLLVYLGCNLEGPVDFVVDVTADNGGPWRYEFTLEVATATAAPSAVGLAADGDRRLALASQAPTLLPNYPNPFNPETWIPFDLPAAGEVTLTIYGMRGEVVRRMALGSLTAGLYRTRGKAARWDGRNAVGEAVPSGVYVYELRVGGYHAARRMVVRK